MSTDVQNDLTKEEIAAELYLLEQEITKRERNTANAVPAVLRPLERPARYLGAYGGRGGMKSHYFAEKLIKKCEREVHRAVCIREIQKSLSQSVKALLESKIKKFNFESKFRITNTEIIPKRGGRIIFQGMQNHTADSIKSLEGYDIAWVEEAQSLSQRSLDLLRPTIREENSEIWMSWNPRFPTDPVDVLLRGFELPPDAVVVRTNYNDNPYFPEVLRKEMEYDRRRNYDKYAHVWLGEYEEHSDARVFNNWKEEDFDTPEGVVFYFGADWGFSVDPSVMVRCFVRDRTLYIDAEVYMIGCEIDDLPALFDCLGQESPYDTPQRVGWPLEQPIGMARQWIITADSARPETISYMQRHGYSRMGAAVKGKDSVKEGVIFLQSFDIVVHPRCKHTLDELKHYNYKKDDLTDTVTPVLEDKKNHVIDSLRYAVEKLRVAAEYLTF